MAERTAAPGGRQGRRAASSGRFHALCHNRHVVTWRRAARSLGLIGALLGVGASLATAGRTPELPRDLPPAARERVAPVAEQASLAVKVDADPFVARRDVFEYLLDHPEFATHVTRALKLARYKIWTTPTGLAIDDGWGTVGTFELVWAAPGVRVMHARGVYHHKILPDIRGQAVVLIDYGVQPAAEGKSLISAAVGGFVKLDSRFMAIAARIATSVATAKGEKEAHRLVRLFARTTRAIENDPAGVFDKVRQRPDVPGRDLEQFRRLLNLPAAAGSAAAPAGR
jgi:hypothetical protein